MRELFNVPEDVRIRLWRRFNADAIYFITELEDFGYDSLKYAGTGGTLESQLLILERQVDGKWMDPQLAMGLTSSQTIEFTAYGLSNKNKSSYPK